MHVLLLLSVLAAPRPEKSEAPKGPPPEVRVVKVSPKGDLVSEVTVMMTRMQTETRREERIVNGMNVVRNVTVSVPVVMQERRQVVHAAKDVKAFSAEGKAIDLKDLAKRLAYPTPVVVSADGRPVDPAYLRLFRKDALVLVLSAAPRMPSLPKLPPEAVPMPKK